MTRIIETRISDADGQVKVVDTFDFDLVAVVDSDEPAAAAA